MERNPKFWILSNLIIVLGFNIILVANLPKYFALAMMSGQMFVLGVLMAIHGRKK